MQILAMNSENLATNLKKLTINIRNVPFTCKAAMNVDPPPQNRGSTSMAAAIYVFV
jgi:hypothetical protein